MYKYNAFWNQVSKCLGENHPEKKFPFEWTKPDIINFIEYDLLIKANAYLAENDVLKEKNQALQFSYDTFRRIFMQDEYNGSEFSKNLFAWYFGYPNDTTFLQESTPNVLSTKTFESERIKDDNENRKNSANLKKKYFTLIFLSITCILPTCWFFVNSGVRNKEVTRIEKVISMANEAEFQAYKSVPHFDSMDMVLKDYFLEFNPAYIAIKKRLVDEKKRGWILSNKGNPSIYELIDVKLERLVDSRAIIKTQEHWTINWFSEKKNDYVYKYSSTNSQYYILKKDKDKWKIITNSYPVENKYLPPATLDSSLLQKINSMSIKDAKISLVHLIEEGKTMTVLELFGILSKVNEKLKNQVVVLKSQFEEWVDHLNNEKISIAKFYDKKGEIDLKLLGMIDKL